MPRTNRYRLGFFAVALALNVAVCTARAPADLYMTVGERRVVQNEQVADCSTKAKNALNTVLTNAFEAGDGTGQWLAYGGPDNSEAAAIHCYPLDNGYSVTFTCTVQVPPSPSMAADLCTKLSAAFAPKQTSDARARGEAGEK